MANVGCDTSKDWVDIAFDGNVVRWERKKEVLEQGFAGLPAGSRVLIEPTGRYHRIVVQCAKAAGHDVRLVDPYAFSLYKRSFKPRASTDKICALALARYAEKEWDIVRQSCEMPKHLRRLKDLLELREKQTALRVAWKQSMDDIGNVPAAAKAAVKSMERSIKRIDDAIYAIVKKDPLYEEFLKIDGIGPVCAPCLVWLFRAFKFEHPDHAVSFVGLDVRVRESGKYAGRRMLTKRGPAFVRRLLACGAQSLRCIQHFKPLFARYQSRGKRVTETNVIVARKIVRTAFAVAYKGAQYERAKFFSP